MAQELNSVAAARIANLAFGFAHILIEHVRQRRPKRPRDLRRTGPASAWRLKAVVARSAS
jgi:hypothetical protein